MRGHPARHVDLAALAGATVAFYGAALLSAACVIIISIGVTKAIQKFKNDMLLLYTALDNAYQKSVGSPMSISRFV